MWIGYDGLGTSAVSPGPSSVQHQVREALLRTDRAAHLGLEVERDVELALVEVGERLAQLRDAVAQRVAVVAGVAHRLDQLLDRDVGRREVGVAEPEVDDVLAGPPQLHLQRVDVGEHVRRQRVDSAKLHVGQVRRRGKRTGGIGVRRVPMTTTAR